MKVSSKNKLRSGKDRRLAKERRRYDDTQYNGTERRMMEERRLILERRSQIMSDRHFHY